MSDFDSDLATLAARASTVMERLEDRFVSVSPPDDPVIDRRLDAWCQAAAKGDWEQFRHRLAWDSLDEASVRPVLGQVELREGVPLPTWTEVIAEATERIWKPDALADLFQPDHPIPFEEVLAPFVLLAEERIQAKVGAAYEALRPQARLDLGRALLSHLSFLAARTLFFQFSLTRSHALSSFALLLTPEGEREVYDDFVASLQGRGLMNFFLAYPVLARELGSSVLHWVEARAEMLQRLAIDRHDLERLFGDGRELGAVEGIGAGLSDPHNGGRTVAELTFEGGQHVIYKPKGLGNEVAFNALINWVNQTVQATGRHLPAFKLVEVLDRGTYGWVEKVEIEACSDEEAARRYYTRAGMLLALLYVLGATDAHMENLIACGEFPILIDLETLLHHRAVYEDMPDQAGASVLAHDQMTSSVLRTGLLPTWQLESDNSVAFDISGLGGVQDQIVSSVSRQYWRETNTDRMSLVTVQVPIQPRSNVATLGGEPLHLDPYASELESGFEAMYRFLIEQREALLAPDGLLAALAEEPMRFVFRPTRVYSLLRHQLLDAVYLRDGADLSIGLDVLTRAIMPQSSRGREAGKRSVFWPLIEAEREAMERGDIPYFAAPAGSSHLPLPSGPVACFNSSSLDWAMKNLRALDEADLRRQLAILQGAVFTHAARGAQAPDTSGPDADSAESAPPSPDELIAAALDIAAEIRERAIRDPDGSLAWIVPHFLIQTERYQLQPTGPALYDGGAGIALFFAALEHVTGAGYRDQALGALQPFRREVREYGARAARYSSIGAAEGIASMVYALVSAARLLDEPDLLADARAAARLITPDRMASDRSLDVLDGAAGAILGLLSLFEIDADEEVLELALRAGDHLLRNRKESEPGPRTWPTASGLLLTGFSHGAAGISYALGRLYQASGEKAFLDAAAEGIAYEDAVFIPEAGNWPDFRQDPPSFMSSWCHGASGIGLARLGGLAAIDTQQIRHDLDVALTTTEVQRVDRHIACCGAMGRVELFLSAGLTLGDTRHVDSAHRLAGRILGQRRQRGAFHVHRLLPTSVYNPSLFQGTAGIGYMLLRMARPDAVPPFLLWR